MWLAFGLAALLVLLGLAVDRFKMYFLISGYNTMSKTKRDNVDIAKVARMIALWAYANAAMLAMVGVVLTVGVQVPWMIPGVFFAVTTVLMLVRIQRYDGNLFDDKGHLRPGAWKQLVVLGALLVALGVGVVVLVVSRGPGGVDGGADLPSGLELPSASRGIVEPWRILPTCCGARW